MKLIVHTDGGARGNPGPAAIGVVVELETGKSKTQLITSFGKTIGEATNNVAEYTAVVEALESIKYQVSRIKENIDVLEIHFYLDSTLVVNQLNGLFKVKDSKMRELLFRVRQLEQGIGGNISYTYIPREQNAVADLLVNKALDELAVRSK